MQKQSTVTTEKYTYKHTYIFKKNIYTPYS